VKVADCPGRNEPGTGEVDYDRFFEELRARSYGGAVGLEYRPSDGDTDRSLQWFRDAGLLDVARRA
jgi:hydroxypyruvate isomerase